MRQIPIVYGNRIIVEPTEEKLSDIIIAPETARSPGATSGRIIDLGHLVNRDEFKIGMEVTFPPHAGLVVTYKGKTMVQLTPAEIFFRLADEEEISGAPV